MTGSLPVAVVVGTLDHLRGATACDGRFVLRAPLFGSSEESVWLGASADGSESAVLIAVGLPTRFSSGELADRLRLPYAGIAPLNAVGTIDQRTESTQVTVEACPEGLLAADAFQPPARNQSPVEAACRLGIAVTSLAAAVHDDHSAIGGIRPDSIWVSATDVATVMGLTPRANLLWSSRRPVDIGVVPGHASVFEAPEVLRGADPGPPADVFSIALTVAWCATGDHPYAVEGRDAQIRAILSDQRHTWAGPPQLARAIDASLGPAEARPTVDELAAELRAVVKG